MASLMEPTKKKARVAFDVTALKIEKTLRCGNLILPGGVESACGLMSKIFIYLDVKSLLKVIESNMVYQLCVTFGSNDFKRVRNEALEFNYMQPRSLYEMIHNPKQLYLLYKRYKNEFPRGTIIRKNIPTPFICACEEGRMNDVEQFINLHGFHAYINMDVAEAGMDVKAMVSQLGYDSDGDHMTPLMIAAYIRNILI